MKQFILSSIFCLYHVFIFSQAYTEKEMINKLTANARQWWLKGAPTTSLGNKCKGGQILIFYSNPNKIVQRTCDKETQTFNDSTLTWKLTKLNNVEWLILIGDRTYKLKLDEDRKQINLKLRIRSGNSIKDFTTVSIYTYFKN